MNRRTGLLQTCGFRPRRATASSCASNFGAWQATGVRRPFTKRIPRPAPDTGEKEVGGLLLPGALPNRAYRLCSDSEHLRVIIGTCDLAR
ncbi:hypothetical protein SXCC_00970 [Gluconacetobacter sp. SXCC-1]|nr:hypothetical protein SXCC_00970 [Gluconacetobacter sp. SXCC-1]